MNIFIRFILFGAAEPRFMSASGRFMHLWCVSCGGAAFSMLSPEGEVVALAELVVLGAAGPRVSRGRNRES